MRKYYCAIAGFICICMLARCSALDHVVDGVKDFLDKDWTSSTQESVSESIYYIDISSQEESLEEQSSEDIYQEPAYLPEEGDAETLYSYERMMRELQLLEDKYPRLLRYYYIGESALGRDIPVVKLGNGDQELLFVGGIHGCEFSTINYMMRCIREYAAAADAGEIYGWYDMSDILDEYTFYIVPMANPDGFEISNHEEEPDWYCEELESKRYDYSSNGNGVNLNRNFPFEWEGAEGGTEPDASKSKGPYAGSEPETQALMQLCSEHDFLWMFSFHNYGHCVYWLDTANGHVEGDEELADQLCDVCGFYKTEATSSPGSYGGGFENWFRYEYSRPGFCVELGLLEYETSVYMEEFEEAVAWYYTRYAMLQGLDME